jgi:hypothetical protein
VKPLQSFAKLSGKDGALSKHENTEYHKEAHRNGIAFLKFRDNRECDVRNQLSTIRASQISENRQRLLPIIKTIIFCGRQNIPQRGHRDHGPLLLNENLVTNEGNFREILRLRVESGDVDLANHLRSASANATYISNTTQLQLIKTIGHMYQEEIIRRIKEVNYFSFIIDETTDIATISQLTVVLRYVQGNSIREDFVGFVDLHRDYYNDSHYTDEPKLTGELIARTTLNMLRHLGLDLKYCVGYSTDGCSVMIGQKRGASATFHEDIPFAVQSICGSHCLNLSLSKGCQVACIRNALSILQEICTFFSASSKRQAVLKSAIAARRDDGNIGRHNKLLSLCETRWIERQDSVMVFLELFGTIKEALDAISLWTDQNSSSKAYSFSKATDDFQFCLTLFVLKDIFSITLPLSMRLQNKQIDIAGAHTHSNGVILVLEQYREEAESHFSEIYKEALENANQLGITVVDNLPRQSSRQVYRNSVPANSMEEFYRRNMYVPAMDDIISDMKMRFGSMQKQMVKIASFLKPVATEVDVALIELVENLSPILPGGDTSKTCEKRLRAEYVQWRLIHSSTEFTTVLDALRNCEKITFPVMHTLLTIFATYAMSVASGERSFSTLRRIKTWCRSQMTEDRLNETALMHMHRDICLAPEDVLDRFAQKRNRKLDFIL